MGAPFSRDDKRNENDFLSLSFLWNVPLIENVPNKREEQEHKQKRKKLVPRLFFKGKIF
jgi:hypothetical protein